jgi:hypothetical protein
LGLGQGQNGKLKFVGKRKCESSSGKLATNVIRPRVVVGGVSDQGARGQGRTNTSYGAKIYEKISRLQRRQTRTTTCTANNRNKADAGLEPRRYHHSQPYDQCRP